MTQMKLRLYRRFIQIVSQRDSNALNYSQRYSSLMRPKNLMFILKEFFFISSLLSHHSI